MKKKKEPGRPKPPVIDSESRSLFDRKADTAGFVGMCIFALIVMALQLYFGLPFGEIPAILMSFVAVSLFARFRTTRDRTFIALGFIAALASLSFLCLYFIDMFS